MIVQEGKKWKVKDSKGQQTFGTHDTKKEALKQLRAIEFSKGTKAMDGGVKSPKRAALEAVRGYKDGGTKKDRMKCNKPTRSEKPEKKFKVKGCQDGKERLIHYGDANMRIKKSNPKNRKSFRARHKCDTAKDKLSARYWSCKKW